MKKDKKLKDILGILSTQQESLTETKEEEEAGISAKEVELLQAREELRKARIQNDILEEGLNKLKQDRGQRKV